MIKARPPQVTAGREHKYLQLAQHFRDRITRGELQAGDRLPTFTEMRKKFGATPATVERMLTLLERDGMVERRAHSGIYVTDPTLEVTTTDISPKKSPRALSIGCVLPASEDGRDLPFWSQLLGGYHEGAFRAEAELVLFHTDSMRGWDKVDGVLCPGGSGWAALEEKVQLYGVPAVVTFEHILSHACITADDADGIRQAMDHLLGLGHRKIAYLIHTEDDLAVSRIRLGAYYESLMRAGIIPNPQWVHHLIQDHSFIVRGRRSMQAWLEEDWRDLGCTALLVQNDRAAIGVMEVLRGHNISVPDDVSIIGFDGTDEAQFCVPALTSVHVPLREMGIRAVEMLAEQIHDPRSMRVNNVFAVSLDVRGSTAPPREDAGR